jgi:hypothetical protein
MKVLSKFRGNNGFSCWKICITALSDIDNPWAIMSNEKIGIRVLSRNSPLIPSISEEPSRIIHEDLTND